MSSYVHVEQVLDFVSRTMSHGAPLRVALRRAERRFGVDRNLIRSFLRGSEAAAKRAKRSG